MSIKQTSIVPTFDASPHAPVASDQKAGIWLQLQIGGASLDAD
jgi:hypothetical protein